MFKVKATGFGSTFSEERTISSLIGRRLGGPDWFKSSFREAVFEADSFKSSFREAVFGFDEIVRLGAFEAELEGVAAEDVGADEVA